MLYLEHEKGEGDGGEKFLSLLDYQKWGLGVGRLSSYLMWLKEREELEELQPSSYSEPYSKPYSLFYFHAQLFFNSYL